MEKDDIIKVYHCLTQILARKFGREREREKAEDITGKKARRRTVCTAEKCVLSLYENILL